MTIPSNLIAGPLGFTKRDFFDAEPAAQQVPTVDLGFTRAGWVPAAPAVPPPRRRRHRPRRPPGASARAA